MTGNAGLTNATDCVWQRVVLDVRFDNCVANTVKAGVSLLGADVVFACKLPVQINDLSVVRVGMTDDVANVSIADNVVCFLPTTRVHMFQLVFRAAITLNSAQTCPACQ